ncbi:phosphotransferase [Nanoarchaeota archaeon]
MKTREVLGPSAHVRTALCYELSSRIDLDVKQQNWDDALRTIIDDSRFESEWQRFTISKNEVMECVVPGYRAQIILIKRGKNLRETYDWMRYDQDVVRDKSMIAPVYAFTEKDGLEYLAMRFIPGSPLAEQKVDGAEVVRVVWAYLLDRTEHEDRLGDYGLEVIPIDIKEIIEIALDRIRDAFPEIEEEDLAEKIARIAEKDQEHGLIHMDLTPYNILRLDGTVCIIDPERTRRGPLLSDFSLF